MATDRFVLLGLAQVRSSWFRDMSRWSTTAVVPVEFVKAMSVEELRARLGSGRSFSALIIDESVVGLDRDLVEQALETGCAVIVVVGDRTRRSWHDLGVSAVLAAGFDRTELLQVLAQVARPIARNVKPTSLDSAASEPLGFRGQLVAVTGAGGTGKSTISIALAQGLARDPRYSELICLADLALDAEQAMLHAAGDVVPGVAELVEAHRSGSPGPHEVRDLTWEVAERGYRLLLGLRRHRDWTAIRPRAFDAALDGLRRGFRTVVADIDDDLEGEATSGSMDIEDRNAMARSTVRSADLVVVVGAPGLKGLHSLLRVIRDVIAAGVPGTRVLPVINRAPRGPRARSEVTATLGELLALGGEVSVPSPLHLSERHRVEDALRDGHRLPDPWLAPLASAVLTLLERDSVEQAPGDDEESAELIPVRIEPGTLGSWTDQDDPPSVGAP